MNRRGAGLRLRLLATVLAAGLLVTAPLAIAVLLQVRDALYARRIADARERLHVAVSIAQSRCAIPLIQGSCESAVAEAMGAERLVGEGSLCTQPLLRQGEEAVLCESVSPRARTAFLLHVQLEPVRAQLDQLDRDLLLALGSGLLVLVGLAVWLLERAVVSRLAGIDAALGSVGAEQDEPVPEGGDALGRLGAAVNRLAGRLREERARTRAQIGALEQANRALLEVREDLARSERLAVVGRLAAGVAHEVGNPITAVIGYAGLMRERLAQGRSPQLLTDDPVADYAQRIEREAGRIDRILRDLIDLARPRATQLVRVDLARAVEEARLLVQPQPSWKGTALEAQLPADLPAARGEEHYVVQVLVNLLANAAKAGARTVRVTGRADESFVFLEVADDGRGIAADALPRLFEPFFTTGAPGEGTGLGLALCHATMERIGGGITARAGASKGAVFELRFRRQ